MPFRKLRKQRKAFKGQEPPSAPFDYVQQKLSDESDIEHDQMLHRTKDELDGFEEWNNPILQNERLQERLRAIPTAPDYPDNTPHTGPFNNPFGPGPNPPPLGPFPFPNKLPPQQ